MMLISNVSSDGDPVEMRSDPASLFDEVPQFSAALSVVSSHSLDLVDAWLILVVQTPSRPFVPVMASQLLSGSRGGVTRHTEPQFVGAPLVLIN